MSSKYRPTDSVNASDDIDARSDVLINSVHKTNAPNETISVQLSGVPLDKVVSNNDVQVNTRVGLNDMTCCHHTIMLLVCQMSMSS